MHKQALADNLPDSVLPDKARNLDQFYSVEINPNPGIVYLFKIWQKETMFMTILAKEDSKFLSIARVNSRYNMKFYSNDFLYPCQNLVTEIRDISSQKQGRLKGHSLISLEIIEDAEDDKINGILYSGKHSSAPRHAN